MGYFNFGILLNKGMNLRKLDILMVLCIVYNF